MDDKRQKIQVELAFMTEQRGESLKHADRGTEPSMATHATESSALYEQLMEVVCMRENLRKALRQVRRNKGSCGIDGMTVDEMPNYLKEHWPDIRNQLLSGTYRPQPVKRVEIPKPGGGVRKLGIPTVLDRFIQQAVLQVLQELWDPTFSEHSFGFRPGRSAHQAVRRAQEYIAQGYRFVVDMDLEKFFDRVNHDILMGKIAKRVSDKRMLKLLRAFLNAGVMENGLVSPTDEGTPQGGPLSPLLSNLMLDDLDRELEKRGHRFVRYADDSNIYVRSKQAGQRVMESIKKFLTQKLKLTVNEKKSAVARPGERKFLGFSFIGVKEPRRRIAPQALNRFKERIREITHQSKGMKIEQVVVNLASYLIGWRGYFGHCETPTVLEKLDGWIKRRLRSMMWRQWKRGTRRFKELRKRGIDAKLASQTAGSAHGPWRLSWSPALHMALSNAYFTALGLPKLAARTNA
jgi:RNA-directed DNA polymerase